VTSRGDWVRVSFLPLEKSSAVLHSCLTLGHHGSVVLPALLDQIASVSGLYPDATAVGDENSSDSYIIKLGIYASGVVRAIQGNFRDAGRTRQINRNPSPSGAATDLRPTASRDSFWRAILLADSFVDTPESAGYVLPQAKTEDEMQVFSANGPTARLPAMRSARSFLIANSVL
jgi:hypothetical protein